MKDSIKPCDSKSINLKPDLAATAHWLLSMARSQHIGNLRYEYRLSAGVLRGQIAQVERDIEIARKRIKENATAGAENLAKIDMLVENIAVARVYLKDLTDSLAMAEMLLKCLETGADDWDASELRRGEKFDHQQDGERERDYYLSLDEDIHAHLAAWRSTRRVDEDASGCD